VPWPDEGICGAGGVGVAVGAGAVPPPDGKRTGNGCAGPIAPENADSEPTDSMAGIIRLKD